MVERFPEAGKNFSVISEQIVSPALSRGSLRIVSQKEVDAIFFTMDISKFFLDNSQMIVGIRRPSGLDVYFTCTVSGSCGHSKIEVIEAIRGRNPDGQVSEVTKAIDIKSIIRQIATADGNNVNDLSKIEVLLDRIHLTEEPTLCLNEPDGEAICNYEGRLVFDIFLDEIAPKLILEYPQAAEIADEGFSIPFHVITMEASQPRGGISFD